MRIRRVFVGLTLAAALAVAASGCKQGVGERCQLDSDCGSGLTCYTGLSDSVPPEGECQPTGYTGQHDASVADDAAAPQQDGGVQSDAAAPQDVAVQDDAQTQDDAQVQDDAAPQQDATTD